MNEVMNAILNRRSVRKFSQKKISDEIISDLVEAGLHAPSGMGKKTWKFTAVTNQEMIGKLASAVGKQLGRDGYNMYAPAAIIIPSNEKDSPFGKEDNACALENIFLAAYSYGVGSVWINQLQGICDTDEVRAVLRELGIPENHIVYGLAALGYPDPDAPKGEYRAVGEKAFVR